MHACVISCVKDLHTCAFNKQKHATQLLKICLTYWTAFQTFAIMWSLSIPLHLSCVATLPVEDKLLEVIVWMWTCWSVDADVCGNGEASGRYAGDDSFQSERSSVWASSKVSHIPGHFSIYFLMTL